MKPPAFRMFRRFARDQRGSMAVVDFAILFPLFLMMFLSSVEMGLMTIRQTLMEHALDRAVREVRIGSINNLSHDTLRDKICDASGTLPDCKNALKLEMVPTDLRSFAGSLNQTPDCVNRSEDMNPVLSFTNGQRSELMLLRVCFVFSPIFPNVGFGYNAQKNAAGDIQLYATTAFVNEPT